MLAGKCDLCQAESNHLDLFAGQKLKCKKCPTGWVTLPAKAGAVYADVAPLTPAISLPALAPANLEKSQEKWQRSHSKPVIDPEQDADQSRLANVADRAGDFAFGRPEDAADQSRLEKYVRMVMVGLIGLGIMSLLLHPMGLQFSSLAFLEPYQPYASLVMAAVGGLGLYGLHLIRN